MWLKTKVKIIAYLLPKLVSAKVLWRQCFIESTSNVSYVHERELGNRSKVKPWPQSDSASG